MLDAVEKRTGLPSALGQTLQRLSAHHTMRDWVVPDLLKDNEIWGEMPSPGNPPGWGSSSSRAGEGWERGQKEMGHFGQGTSVSSTSVTVRCSVVSM